MSDRRLTPANSRVALRALKGEVAAARYVDGDWSRVTVPVADLLASPGGPRDRQMLMGDRVLVLDQHDGHGFIQAEKDGYCGYVAMAGLGRDRAATHWVCSAATHLYSAPDIKKPEIAALSHGVRLTIRAEHPHFLETAEGYFVPVAHLRAIGDWLDDPAGVAERFIGTPYLWGGNSRAGIDCSGLIQAALLACGMACPGDSDLQLAALGHDLAPGTAVRRGDLIFWKGHVAIVVDAERMIHANAFHMAVTCEEIAAATARIAAQGGGEVLAIKRL